ncbi:hypothetical protein Ocin01_14956 [Orchesella cincta]|uniref:CHK kinase-like domain-containing protein n=1 Tax=Orchesella cincta TaxID=48709 RepID=A0A1D2MFG9_ORCCI|nr:hypothetical protein Ocin01_14956 [Orchesella cincta]
MSSELKPVAPKSSVPRELIESITGCKVLSHIVEDGSKPGDNYMSVLYSVSAEVIPPGGSEADKETRHYLLKCYPGHPARQAYLNKSNIFNNELSFYTVWVKELVEFQTRDVGLSKDKVIVPAFPPCVGGKTVNFKDCEPEALTKVYSPLDNFIMMVDLRKTWGFTMAERTKGFDPEHVELAFTELATIHALSWAYRNRVEYDLIKKFPFLQVDFEEEEMQMWKNIIYSSIGTAVSTMDSVLGEGNHLSKSTEAFREVVMKIIEYFIDQTEGAEHALWELHRDPPKDLVEASVGEKPWRIISHGDSWCNNMLFQHNKVTKKAERIMLVDFQLTRDACPTADLVYLVYTSTTLEYRKAHLDEALQLYHDRFNEVCSLMGVETLPDFNMTSLKRRFHRSKLMGYMMATIGLPIMLIQKGEEINLEDFDQNVNIEEMMTQAFGNKNEGQEYKKRIIDVAQELYDDGVI